LCSVRFICGANHTRDSLHGEIEVFNKRGRHLGAADAVSGVFTKDPDKRKSIDVS